MQIVIKVFPAKNGDCFLISYGDKTQSHIMVDCGFVDTYKYFYPELRSISEKGEYLEKLIITHIDSDHILGAIKLLRENEGERDIRINEVWHNSYRHLNQMSEKMADRKTTTIIKRIIQRGYHKHNGNSAKQTISAEHGTTLAALLLKGGYEWNSDFNSEAVCVENGKEIGINPTSKIHLLSPNKEKLSRLQQLWKDELLKFGAAFSAGYSELYDDAFEMLMSWEKEKENAGARQISQEHQNINDLLKMPFDEDNTITNGSSIAFILTIGNKQLLFLGDAQPSLVVKSLNELRPSEQFYFDLIKISHHGSFNNISKELLAKVDGSRYVFSTNGVRHKHPDRATLAHIVTRTSNRPRALYFNYKTESSEFFNRCDWMKKYNYSIHYVNDYPYSIQISNEDTAL